MKTTALLSLFISVASALPLAAQAPAFDTSGDGQLNGTYYFRHVLYAISTSADETGVVGDISEAISVYGSIVFNGSGGYTINNGVVNDSNIGVPVSLQCYDEGAPANCTLNNGVTGTYSVSASGYGFISNPITGDAIYGLVAGNGIFSGSSTESTSAYNDLFIAAPIPSPLPAGFSGSYTVVGFQPAQDFAFAFSPGGGGNGGTVGISGYAEGYGSQIITQSSNLTYTFRNGAAVVTFPTNNNAAFYAGGQIFLYFSQDGKFFFGGSPQGYDMVVGVSNGSGSTGFGSCNGSSNCLYYQAGIDQDVSQIANTGYADLDGYFGSFNAAGNGNVLGNERLSDEEAGVYSWSYIDSFPAPLTGSYTDNNSDVFPLEYWVGDNGTVRIGQGVGPYLAISVAFQAPNFTPSGPVYINPTGIVNAASFSPFTAGVSNGEFITIFGTNLASATEVASTVPYPTTLDNVQVLVDGLPIPLYYVSSGQIAAIFPSGYPYSLAPIQISNNGSLSNVVTMPLGAPQSAVNNVVSPGIYTNPSGGVYAAAVDTNTAQIVTPSTPANPNDTVEVFMTGLGQVYPSIQDGSAPPISPLSQTVNTVTADVDGVSATVSFAGLAPTLAGLYQVNVTIPSTIGAGDHFLDISVVNPSTQELESYTSQVLISVGGGAAARAADVPAQRHARRRTSNVLKPPLCLPTSKTGCQR